jgi:hypothetical protein
VDANWFPPVHDKEMEIKDKTRIFQTRNGNNIKEQSSKKINWSLFQQISVLLVGHPAWLLNFRGLKEEQSTNNNQLAHKDNKSPPSTHENSCFCNSQQK